MGQAAVGGAIEQEEAGFGSVVAKDSGDSQWVNPCGCGEGNSIIEFELATAGKVFGDDGVVSLLTKLIGITREGGEEGEGIVDSQDFESAGGQFAGEAIEKESDFAVGADGADAGGGEGESFGLGIEGFEGAGDEVGGGGDKKIGFDAFADPLIDCGTKTVNHDGDADGHGNGDGESGGG